MQVYVGLSSGCVQVYRRGADGAWQLREPLNIYLGSLAVSALLPINTHVYAACGDNVHVIDCFTAEVTVSLLETLRSIMYIMKKCEKQCR